MGGVSESQITLTGGRALFSGIVRTENNGGFASVRTRNLNPPLNLSNYEGIELQVQGDGKRYKLILRCEGRWDGIGYCYSFDTFNRTWQRISIPFRDLIPVVRAKTMGEAAPFDSSNVYALQLMQSKFEYDGAINPRFSPGLFALEIVTIKAYGGKNRLIIVKEGEIAEKSLLDASGYPYEAIDSWLLEQHSCGHHPPTLRFYQWSPPAISLGYHQRQYPDFWRDLTWQGQTKMNIFR